MDFVVLSGMEIKISSLILNSTVKRNITRSGVLVLVFIIKLK